MKSPISIIASIFQDNQEQKNRKQRLQELEDSNKFNILHPVKSIKTKKEIDLLKEQINLYQKKKRTLKIVICSFATALLIICFALIMSMFGNSSSTYPQTFESECMATADKITPSETTEISTAATPTEASTHIHQYKDADCTNPEICVSCGETKGKANGHKWTSATCTAPKTCTVCGKTSGSPTSHDYYNGECTLCGKCDPDYVYETMVWIPTNGGTKYHSHAGCSNMNNPDHVTQSYAESLGFTPCKRCH